MTGSILPLVSYLARSVGLLLGLWAAYLLWKMRWRNSPTNSNPIALNWDLALDKSIRVATNGALVLVGMLIGYGLRDHQLLSHMSRLTDLKILERYDGYTYLVQGADGGQAYELKFCHDFMPDFDPGMTLKTISFEEMGTCNSLTHSDFKVERDVVTGKFISWANKKEQP